MIKDDDLDEEDFNTDSEEEAEKKQAAELFPGLNLAPKNAQEEDGNSLQQIDEAEDETASPMATLSKVQARKLSKFFEPTAFAGLNPTPVLTGKLEGKKEPEVNRRIAFQ